MDCCCREVPPPHAKTTLLRATRYDEAKLLEIAPNPSITPNSTTPQNHKATDKNPKKSKKQKKFVKNNRICLYF